MTHSMTGFATRRGQGAGYTWVWDLRSVNGKGLDLRLRLPDWVDGLEAAVRGEVTKAVPRGNLSLSLKVTREETGDAAGFRVNAAALQAALAALAVVEAAAMDQGVTLAQASQADVLAMRGVMDAGAGDQDTTALRGALMAEVPGLLAEFAAMRAAEGRVLQAVIGGQLDQIAALTTAAGAEATARGETAAEQLRASVARVMAVAEGMDATRLAQEMALLAVKNDVTEEIDRLGAHLSTARALLVETGPVGRKFDFLMQEFMREANTLCSKAQALTVTRIGLDLKTVIDQMREQVQNVE